MFFFQISLNRNPNAGVLISIHSPTHSHPSSHSHIYPAPIFPSSIHLSINHPPTYPSFNHQLMQPPPTFNHLLIHPYTSVHPHPSTYLFIHPPPTTPHQPSSLPFHNPPLSHLHLNIERKIQFPLHMPMLHLISHFAAQSLSILWFPPHCTLSPWETCVSVKSPSCHHTHFPCKSVAFQNNFKSKCWAPSRSIFREIHLLPDHHICFKNWNHAYKSTLI